MAPGSPWLLDVDTEIGSEEVLNVVEAEVEELEDPSDFYIWSVLWNIFFHILGIIIPIDFHIFQRG